MDNEMMERCAKALADYWLKIGFDPSQPNSGAAKAIIKAMREPTQKIIDTNIGSIHWASDEAWQIYIDAILGDE